METTTEKTVLPQELGEKMDQLRTDMAAAYEEAGTLLYEAWDLLESLGEEHLGQIASATAALVSYKSSSLWASTKDGRGETYEAYSKSLDKKESKDTKPCNPPFVDTLLHGTPEELEELLTSPVASGRSASAKQLRAFIRELATNRRAEQLEQS